MIVQLVSWDDCFMYSKNRHDVNECFLRLRILAIRYSLASKMPSGA